MKLFVANFHSGTADYELEHLFSKYGTVDSAYVCHDFESGESRGFGFVEMPDEDDAEDAIDRLNGKWLNGKKLKVSKALR
jgi:cold-inducible RNA-binding protein